LEQLEARIQESIALIPAVVEAAMPKSKAHKLAVTAAWVAGGVGVLTLGLIAGRELRGRYKFNRRTPYDYYAHAGEQTSELEFGVGV
jgi:hypothetical protein